MWSRAFHESCWKTLCGSICKVLIIFSAALFFAANNCNAQDITGRIAGSVTDPSGAAVPNTTVSIVNEATGAVRKITADQNGYFVADQLPAGTYTITGENTGFKKTTKAGNIVTAGGRLTVDLTLQVGALTETVFVTGVGDTVNTTSGEISTTITQKQIQNLAMNQRHYEALIGLVPGAALQGSGTNPAAVTINYNNSVAVTNGQRLDGQNWSVDGGFNLDSGSNNSVFNQVGADFIQEVDVQSSNYDAEFGRSDSSTINVVTRSGGEKFHGGGFEFVQNNVFNAENAGTKLTTPTALNTGYTAVPPFHYNNFGWEIGGPIPYIQPKGKLFFFAGQEWKRFRGVYPGTANSASETFPTAAEVGGNFSDVNTGATPLLLKTPAVIPASCSGGVLYTSQNVINPTCITGDGAAIASLYTAAAALSSTGGLPTVAAGGNLSFNLAGPINIREDIIRVDEHLNEKQSIYFRYLHDFVSIYNPFSTFGAAGALPVDADLRLRPGYNLQLSWTDVIRPNLVNEAKINADWHAQRTPVQGNAWMKSTYGFGFIPPLGNPAGQFADGLPTIGFTAASAFPTSGPAGVNGPAPNYLAAPVTDINPVDNVSWTKHDHAFKFGAEFVRDRKTQNSRTNYDGTLTFSPNAGATTGSNSTGDAFADALLGNFNSLQQNSAVTTGQFRFNDFEAYGQDTWRVSRKLSLVLGVRYIHTTPTYTTGNNMTNFNPFAFNTALEPSFTGGLATSNINPASPGLCSGPLLSVVGTPVLTIECNGLQRPGQVPTGQAASVPVTSADPTLLAAINTGASRGFYKPENLWGPRIGFAYSPFSDNKTVVRAGFGIFYDKPEGNILGLGINSQGYAPWAQTASISGTNASLSQFDSAPGAATVPAPTTISLNGVNPNLVVARSYQYSLGVQHELPEAMLLQVAYVGNLGRHLLRGPSFNNATWTQQGYIPASPNPNNLACPAGTATAYNCSAGFAPTGLSKDQIRPYLGYGNIQMALSDANSNYNALQVSLTKRAGFFTTSFSYTYSKVMGQDGGAGDAYNENAEPECPFTCLVSTAANPVLVNGGTAAVSGGTQTGGVVESWQQYYKGKASFDATHIVATTFTLESPWGKNRSGVVGGAVKGWLLSAIMHYQSGAPLTATASKAVGLNGNNLTRRANIVAGQSLSYSASGTTCPAAKICWVNPNAFATEGPLGAGDAPIGDIIGPNFYDWDLSLRKSFSFGERASLQIEGDAFNAFNRTNWNNPTVNNAGSTSFGQITTSLPARVLQLGGKITF